MAYEKQIWVDNASPLNAERMNHIEEGIGQVSEEMVTEDRVNELIDAKIAAIPSAEEVSF